MLNCQITSNTTGIVFSVVLRGASDRDKLSTFPHLTQGIIQELQLVLVHTLSYITLRTLFRFADPAALDLGFQLISISH
jgi:hypothetical protein